MIAFRDDQTLVFKASQVKRLWIDSEAGDNEIDNQTDLPSTLLSGGGNDSIDGGDGPDWIYGGLGNNSINGNGGNDTLRGKLLQRHHVRRSRP